MNMTMEKLNKPKFRTWKDQGMKMGERGRDST